jgi:DNA-binding CsgD family transcriptional regulator/N-acetylneuraminic acid mutarotase
MNPLPSELSERELEILRLVATGASNKEVASQLYISSNTVKVHLRNIFSKIGAASRTEAAMYAVRIGLVEGAPAHLPTDDASALLTASNDRAAAVAEATPSRRIWPRWLTALAALFLVSIGGIAFALGRSSTPQPTAILPTPPPATATAFPRWQTLAQLPTARRGLTLAAYENLLYAIGGETSQGITGTLEVYDINTDTWHQLPEKPTPATDVGAAVLNGLVYVPGGRIGQGGNEITAQLEIYDPVAAQWRTGADLPYPTSAYALTAFEGRLYLFGGWDGYSVSSRVFMYDPTLDSWQERSPMPTARSFCGAAVAGGKIYVIGGMADNTPLTANEIYSPTRESPQDASPWETGFPLPDARQGLQVTTIADTVYVLGGAGQSVSRFGLIYFPPTNTWQSLEASPQPLGAYFGLSSIGPQLYIVGGDVDGTLSDQTLAYQALITFSIPIIIK